MPNTVRRYDRPLKRMFSLGRGRGYVHRLARCSRCYGPRAHWLQKQGCFQRYYCDECIKVTAAWKHQQAAEAEGE